MSEKVELLLRTLDTFSKDLVVEDTKVTTLCFNNEEGKLLNNYIQELQHQLEEKDKVINEIEKRCNQEISSAMIQYERHKRNDTWQYIIAHKRILEILERGKNNENS